MVYPFLVVLREGVEASLIIAIIASYLVRIGQRHHLRPVLAGAGAALLASALAGVGAASTARTLRGPALEVFEGVAMLLAVCVLTSVIIWMGRQAASMREHLQRQVDRALTRRTAAALASLSFALVVREGVETVLFLLAGAAREPRPWVYGAAIAAGLACAALAGVALYRGTRRLPLRAFFHVSSVLLVLFAAGMLVNGIGELQEVGWLPALVNHVWDSDGLLSDTSEAGRFVAALFGYTASPSLLQVLAYLLYLPLALLLYYRPTLTLRRQPPVTAALTLLALVGLTSASGCSAAAGGQPPREVRLILSEHRFEPARVEAKAGERLRFVLENRGQVDHEFESEAARIEEVTVPPGRTRAVEWTAPARPGDYEFECDIAGHAGMKGTISVR